MYADTRKLDLVDRIYPKYSDSLTPCHTITTWTSQFDNLLMPLKFCSMGWKQLDLIRPRFLQRLIWVYTIGSDLSVRRFRKDTALSDEKHQ